jgi:isoaspartyl peptidase/L-asparaginase-like protein (Ntn-hydrolase superfamily)
MEKYGDPSKAIQEALSILEKKTGGYGGVVALTSEGKIGFGYNTPRMARGYMTSEMRNPVVDL